MIYPNNSTKFWHRNPKKRTFLEKVARRFTFPRYHDMAMSWGAWETRKKRLKANFPFRWFCTETLPDLFTDWVKFPTRTVKQFVRYRVKDRYHVVPTGLKPGYADPDTRMFHSAFQLLVDYVEIELAAMHHAAEESETGESSKSFYGRIKKFRAKQTNNPEAGLAYLDWEINESAGAHIPHGTMTQSQAAMEKKFLYLWWTKDRPARAELYKDPLIWSHQGYDPDVSIFNQDCGYQYHLVSQLEAFYIAEDTEMFHRLVEIRTRMWT